MAWTLLTSAAVCAAAQTAPQSVRFDGGTAVLDGPWAFHIGDSPRWSEPGFDDSGWENISPSEPWGAQGHRNTAGFAWYRRKVALGERAPQTLAVLVPWAEDAYEVYWNGKLVGGLGRLPPRPVWYTGPLPSRFPLGPATGGVLAVRVWKAPFGSFDTGLQGGFYGPPVIGDPGAVAVLMDAVNFDWLQSQQLLFALNSLYALVSFLCFIAWLRDRRQWLVFWMAMYAGGRVLLFLGLSARNPFPFVLTIGLSGFAFALCDVSLWFVLYWLLGFEEDRQLMSVLKVLAAVDLIQAGVDAVLLAAFTLPNPVTAQRLDGVMTVILTVLEFVPFYLIGRAVLRRHRLDPARWTVALLAFITQMLNAGTITLAQGSRYTHLTLATQLAAPLFTVLGSPVNAATLSGFLLLLSLAYAVWRYSVESRRTQTRLEQEIRNARAVQQVLVPEAIPSVPGFHVESVYKPAGEVGGDFFQILPLSDGGVLVAIGDVSGKGIPAAMTVSLLVGTLRTLAHYTESPAEILTSMNQRMIGRSHGGFTTCLIARADRNRTVTVANAGHLAPYLNGEELSLDNGLPLGLAEDARYTESMVRLSETQQLTLLTDGVIEARSAGGELFGFERTAAIAGHSADSIAQAARAFGQEDDITVLTLRREAVDEAVPSSAAVLSPG
ncbi:MAG: SpoIIE family protein phosphatase [Acidobacteriaceae bacterium]